MVKEKVKYIPLPKITVEPHGKGYRAYYDTQWRRCHGKGMTISEAIGNLLIESTAIHATLIEYTGTGTGVTVTPLPKSKTIRHFFIEPDGKPAFFDFSF
jgi:hypothetical protein